MEIKKPQNKLLDFAVKKNDEDFIKNNFGNGQKQEISQFIFPHLFWMKMNLNVFGKKKNNV